MNEICNDLIENTHIDEINELTVKLKIAMCILLPLIVAGLKLIMVPN